MELTKGIIIEGTRKNGFGGIILNKNDFNKANNIKEETKEENIIQPIETEEEIAGIPEFYSRYLNARRLEKRVYGGLR